MKGTLRFSNSSASEMGLGVDAVLRAWHAFLLSMSFNRFLAFLPRAVVKIQLFVVYEGTWLFMALVLFGLPVQGAIFLSKCALAV